MATATHSSPSVTQDLGYKLKRAVMYIGGKEAAVTLGEVAQGIVTGLGMSMGTIVAMSGIAAISGSLTQMDYQHKRDRLCEDYKEEIAAKRHKPVHQLNDQDLEITAKENRTLSEALTHAKRQRNFGIFLSIASSLTSFLVVGAVLGGMGHGLGAMAAKGLAGLITYNLVKAPLHYVGDKLFGLEKETMHERIMDLKRAQQEGKAITREQVVEVFVQANPELERVVSHLNLDNLINDINQNKVNVTELAFAVDGQISGVHHEGRKHVQAPVTMLGAVWRKCADAVQSLTAWGQAKAESGTVEAAAHSSIATTKRIVQFNNDVSDRSFVQGLNRPKRDSVQLQVNQILQRSQPQEGMELK